MPRKGSKNDIVSLVRSRLPQFADLPREKIELALLYYDSDVDLTVQAFQRDGAIDALSGWTEMTHDRGNNGTKRPNGNSTRKTPSNGLLRPSQRVSNLFQTFADTGVPTVVAQPAESQPSSVRCSTSSENNINSSSEISSENVEKPTTATATATTTITTTTVTKTSPLSDNRKILTKSAKDLQRQTSTLSNVENSFENEMKSSVKRISDVFKEIREILKEREVQLYLEMDKAKDQGLAVIHRRQERASQLRQRMDQCDRLEANEIDHLRTDIKHFVTDRRYDLGEELTSSHRFEYDQSVIEALKHFGTVLRLERSRTASTSNNNEFAPTTPTSNSFVEPKTSSATQTNGFHQQHQQQNGDESKHFQMKPPRRRTAEKVFQYHNGGNSSRRPRAPPNGHQNSEINARVKNN